MLTRSIIQTIKSNSHSLHLLLAIRDRPSYRGKPRQYRGQSASAGPAPLPPSQKQWAPRPKLTFPKKGRNPVDTWRQVTHCSLCDSVNHWAPECPDRPCQPKSNTNTAYFAETPYDSDVLEINHATNDVILFQSDYDNPTQLRGLVAESWNHAVLDSGASATVCGLVRLNTYIACLNAEDKASISCKDSRSVFHFGDGRHVQSTKTACIPAYIGPQKAHINTAVVNQDILFLLSRLSMKKANMQINFEDDTAHALGHMINLSITRSGHYILPLTRATQLLPQVTQRLSLAQQNITLHLSKESIDQSKSAIAEKLHRQFAHAPAEKMIHLLNNAGSPWREVDEPKMHLRSTVKNCQTCKLYKKPHLLLVCP